jgi:hypothetical protein
VQREHFLPDAQLIEALGRILSQSKGANHQQSESQQARFNLLDSQLIEQMPPHIVAAITARLH